MGVQLLCNSQAKGLLRPEESQRKPTADLTQGTQALHRHNWQGWAREIMRVRIEVGVSSLAVQGQTLLSTYPSTPFLPT